MEKEQKALATLMQYGFSSELASRLVGMGYTKTKLAGISKSDLSGSFTDPEIDEILTKSKRQPIPEDVFIRLVDECDWKCCICWDIDSLPAVVVHHIVKHAKTQDNSYENLVVLCPTHHALAHTKSEIAKQPLPPDAIRKRKAEFIAAIAEWKAGKRAGPGREGKEDGDPQSQSDLQALMILRKFLDRPALQVPFHERGNMHDFYAELGNFTRALNTGLLANRAGDELKPMKSRHDFSNPHWREQLALVAKQFGKLKTVCEKAVGADELVIEPDGMHYVIYNPELPEKINTLQNSILAGLNQVFGEAGLPPLPPVG